MAMNNCNISEEIQEILEIRDELSEDEFVFYDPVSDTEIVKWEEEHEITIPEQYKEWLKFSNGAKLAGEFVRFFALNQFIINDADYEEPIVTIGNLIGDGEILAFSIRTAEILRIIDGNTRRFEDFKQYLLFLINIL